MKTAFLFFIFIRSCRKYGFTYVLNTYENYSIILRPNRTFENIYISTQSNDYVELFTIAINKMRNYSWRIS